MTIEHDPTLDRLLKGLAPPQPPPSLRSRVLETARERAAAQPRADVWSKLWASRGLRLAWASAAALLLAAHVLISFGGSAARTAASPDPVVDRAGDGVLFELLRPVRITENVEPLVGRGAGDDQVDSVMKGSPS